MRVLFSSIHGHGHVYPLLPLAIATRNLGHDVAFATGEAFHPTLTALGFEAIPAGKGIHEAFAELPEAAVGREQLSQEQLHEAAARVFGVLVPRSFVTDLTPVIERMKPDLVVHEYGNPGAGLAAKIAGVPGISHGIGRVNSDDFEEHLIRGLSTYAAELGVSLPEVPYLDIYPLSLQNKEFAMSPNRVALRPIPFTEPGPLPAHVVNRDKDRPLVYLTLGTAMASVDVLRPAIEGLCTLDVSVLVATGPKLTAADLGELPENVIAQQWVPQADLLGHVDLVVHHGGSGTTLGALGAGAVQLFLPQGADQFSNANVVSDAGAGAQLLHDEVYAESVGAQAKRLLADGSAPAKARGIAEEIAGMPHPDEVAKRLAEFAG